MNTILWARHHVMELGAVTAPVVGAAAMHAWWPLAVTVAFAARWALAERTHRPEPYPGPPAIGAREPADLIA